MGEIASANLPSGSKVKFPSERRSMSRTATRALDVLELFGQMRRPLRAIEIARSLGLQGSTTDQLLKTMVDSTHLVFDAAHKTYRPSHHFVGFAGWITETYGTEERIHKLLDDLHERSGLSASLLVPNDLFLQISEITLPASRITERGLKISMFGTAAGSAYLASLGDAEVVALARRARLDEPEIAALMQRIAPVRERGYADELGMMPMLWTVSAALPAGCLPFSGVVSLSGPSEDLCPYRASLGQLLREAIAHHLR